MRLDYRNLLYFWTVASRGELARAAAKLSIPLEALVHGLNELQEQAGHRLFEQRRGRLVATAAARCHVCGSIGDFDTALEGLPDERTYGARPEKLRFGVQHTLARTFQMAVLEPLLTRRNTRISVCSGPLDNLLIELMAGRVDIILSRALPDFATRQQYVVHTLAAEPVALMSSRFRPLEGRSLLDLLSREPIIVPREGHSIRTGLDRFLAREGFQANIVAEVDDADLVKHLLLNGAGLAITAPIVMRDELATGQAIKLFELPELTERFYAILPGARPVSPAVLALLVHLGEPLYETDVAVNEIKAQSRV